MKMNRHAGQEISILEERRIQESSLACRDHVHDEQIKGRPETAASMQISGELNQSLSCPRSSMSCSAPTATLKVAKPKKSKRDRLMVDLGQHASDVPRKATMPNGTLM